MKHIVWTWRKSGDTFTVYKGAVSFEIQSSITAEFLANSLNEGDMLRSMCRRAAEELGAHCDGDGYGPVNLMNRLNGDSPPDYYPKYMK